MSAIDLERGEPDPAETPSARRRREKRESSGSSTRSSRTSGDESGLVTRLDTAFVKIADQMAARDDVELAEAIRQERRAMSQGLVSLTSSITPLRVPLVLFLALLEPVLAFWRVGRILFIRFLAWRERRIIAMQEAERDHGTPAEHAGMRNQFDTEVG